MTRTPIGTASSITGGPLTFSDITLTSNDVLIVMFAANWTGVGADPKIQITWGSYTRSITLHQSGVDPQCFLISIPSLFVGTPGVGTNNLTLTRTSGASLDNFCAMVTKYTKISDTTAPDDYVEGNLGDNFITLSWLTDSAVNPLTRATVQAHELVVGFYFDICASPPPVGLPSWDTTVDGINVPLTLGQTITSTNLGNIIRLMEGYAEVQTVLGGPSPGPARQIGAPGLDGEDILWTLIFSTFKLGADCSVSGYTSYDIGRFDISSPESPILPEYAKKMAQGDLRFVPGRS